MSARRARTAAGRRTLPDVRRAPVAAAAAAEFCDLGRLGDAEPVTVIPVDVVEQMHRPAVTSGSRWCAAPVHLACTAEPDRKPM